MKHLFYLFAFILIDTAAIAQVNLHDGLIARFRFNGDASDATSNNYDGTLHGNATANGKLQLGDNTNDYVTIPAAIMNGLGDFTVAFTIRFNDLHTDGSFPTNHFLTGSGALLDRIGFSYEKNMNSWRAAINGSTSNFFDDNVVAGTVYCVCIMRSGSSCKEYVNQNLLGTTTTSTALLSISSLLIGQEEDCSGGCFAQNQCMDGGMNNLCFWNRALNEDEVNAMCLMIPEKQSAEETKNEITIHPNPVSDILILSEENITTIEVYDVRGHLIQNDIHSNQIDVHSFAPGLYILKVFTPDGASSVLKFIKE